MRNHLDQCKWVETETICALPYEVPIPGYRNQTCNTLRLWSAKGRKYFDTKIIHNNDYINVSYQKNIFDLLSAFYEFTKIHHSFVANFWIDC